MPLETPVAFFIFNRPETTKVVFAEIARARPQKLLVIGDGPRAERAGEAERVAAARAVVERVDWPCDVKRLYRKENLGCKRSITEGLGWVFDQVPEAIFLEDDCLPDPTFFTFCEALLQRYRDDPCVAAISGNNFQDGRSRTPFSYYFSKYFHCWGWASWRRVWQNFDLELRGWPDFQQTGGLLSLGDSPRERAYWQTIFARQHAGQIDTWDYSWLYSSWAQRGLTILPAVNLVSNIGFGQEATHTVDSRNPNANLPRGALPELHHPSVVVRHLEADRYTFERCYDRPRGLRRWLSKLRLAA